VMQHPLENLAFPQLVKKFDLQWNPKLNSTIPKPATGYRLETVHILRQLSYTTL